MSWVLHGSATVSVVTLKYIKTATVKKQAQIKKWTYPGGLPFILSLGTKGYQISAKGYAAEQGQDADWVESHIINPMLSLVRKNVGVSAPQSRYDGNWIVTEFQFKELPGVVNAFEFKMKLDKGQSHFVV